MHVEPAGTAYTGPPRVLVLMPLRGDEGMRPFPAATRSMLPLLIENIILYVTMCGSYIRPSSGRESVLLRARETVHRDIPVTPRRHQFSSGNCQMDNASAVIHTVDAPKPSPERSISVQGDARVKLPLARRASHPSIALSASRALVSPSAYRSEVRNSKYEPQTLRGRKDLCTVIRRPPSQRYYEVRLSSLVPT